MSLKVELIDGAGSGHKAHINGEGEVNVVVHPHPPKSESVPPQPYRAYFTLDGDGVTNDMQVAASAASPSNFCIKAINDFDIYVKTVAVVIADQNATLNQFGNLTALTNGVEFKHITQDVGETIIHESLTSNFDFVRLAGGQPPFGDGTTAFRGGNIVGTSEGYIPTLDMFQIFGLQYGIRLRAGTTDQLCFIVKDDTTGVDGFDAIAYGIKF